MRNCDKEHVIKKCDCMLGSMNAYDIVTWYEQEKGELIKEGKAIGYRTDFLESATLLHYQRMSLYSLPATQIHPILFVCFCYFLSGCLRWRRKKIEFNSRGTINILQTGL
jgi:hypothetical protein